MEVVTEFGEVKIVTKLSWFFHIDLVKNLAIIDPFLTNIYLCWSKIETLERYEICSKLIIITPFYSVSIVDCEQEMLTWLSLSCRSTCPDGVLWKKCSLKFYKIHRKTPVPEAFQAGGILFERTPPPPRRVLLALAFIYPVGLVGTYDLYY